MTANDYTLQMAFQYDPVNYTARWYLYGLSNPAIVADKWRFELTSDAADGVRDLAGNPLDGEWQNGADTFPSGDGTAGGDFALRLNRLAGDATGDGRVNSLDLADVRRRLNRSATDPASGPGAYSIYADLDGSGRINATDLAAVRRNLSHRLPDGEPAAAAAVPALAPPTSDQPGDPESSATRQLLNGTPDIL